MPHYLNADAKQRPSVLGQAPGDDATDTPPAGERHKDVERREEVRDLQWSPVETKVKVVVAGGEHVEGEDEQKVTAGDLQEHPGDQYREGRARSGHEKRDGGSEKRTRTRTEHWRTRTFSTTAASKSAARGPSNPMNCSVPNVTTSSSHPATKYCSYFRVNRNTWITPNKQPLLRNTTASAGGSRIAFRFTP